MRVLPSERLISGNGEGAPLPDSHSELPPVIRRTEFVAFALAGLLLIAIVAVLYVGKAFFLPVVMAFVTGTMSWLRILAGVYLIFAMAVTLMRHSPALSAYLPDVFLSGITPTDKENLAPYRVVHFLALAFLATHLIPADHPGLNWRPLQAVITCGEEWLAVFCIAVFLSFAGHLILITGPNLMVMQIAVSLVGFAALTGVAYYISWSKRQDLPAALRQQA